MLKPLISWHLHSLFKMVFMKGELSSHLPTDRFTGVSVTETPAPHRHVIRDFSLGLRGQDIRLSFAVSTYSFLIMQILPLSICSSPIVPAKASSVHHDENLNERWPDK